MASFGFSAWPVVVCGPASGGLHSIFGIEGVLNTNGSLVTIDGLRRIARITLEPVEVRERHPFLGEWGPVCWPLGKVGRFWFDERARELRGIFETQNLHVQRALEDAFFDGTLARIGLSAILSGIRITLPGHLPTPIFEPRRIEYVDLTGDAGPACGGHFCQLSLKEAAELGSMILDRGDEVPPGRMAQLREMLGHLKAAMFARLVA